MCLKTLLYLPQMYSLYVNGIVQIINWINNWYCFIGRLDSFRGDNILELFAMVVFSEDIPEDFDTVNKLALSSQRFRSWKAGEFLKADKLLKIACSFDIFDSYPSMFQSISYLSLCFPLYGPMITEVVLV